MADYTQLLSQFLYGRLPQIGAGSGSASGVLTVSTTSAATIADSNETTLWTYSLPANTLNTDGRIVRITVWGTLGATANTKTLRLKIPSVVNFISSTSTANGLNFTLRALLIRTGASAEAVVGEQLIGTSANAPTVTTAASDTTAAITISFTGQNDGAAAANDTVFKGALVELLN